MGVAMLLAIAAQAQSAKDTADNPLYIGPGEVNRPTKAALLAAVFPGAGQAYNKRYWKLPFVYGGAVAFGLVIEFNHRNYIQFRNALVFATDNDPTTQNLGRFANFPNDGLRRGRDYYRRTRDYAIILSTAFYGLVIVDAVVDAHLRSFDVSPDLTLDFRPSSEHLIANQRTIGVGCILTF